uniref:NCK-interacting protein with SH3 domain n=1 Tax=Anthurium amnicola TaxID=1678845 RepID=A0A1D1XWM9_9ARAE
MIRIFLFLLAFIATLASATISITFPSTQYYLVAGQTNNIFWTYEITDTRPFSIFLTNPQIPDLKQFALANNVAPNLGNQTVTIGETLVGAGFQLLFTDIGNIATIYTMSQNFEIKPLGTPPTQISTPTPTPTPAPTSDTPSNNTSAHKNSSSSIYNHGFGTLVLITLFTIILF